MGQNDVIRIGGLMRCCIESVREAQPGAEGDEIPCRHHKDDKPVARFRDGAWEWVGPQWRPEVFSQRV